MYISLIVCLIKQLINQLIKLLETAAHHYAKLEHMGFTW